jgi:CRISPR-associated endonuclease Csn1
MKTILGLDLGTNSIGWALVKQDFENKKGEIIGMGSRIIPMGQDIKDEFGKGNSISKTADRTKFRSIRRLRERHILRRERLHRVLNVLGFLPEHYKNDIDFEKRLGQFKEERESKIAWKKNKDNKFEFLFQSAFLEMANDFSGLKVPYDWTIYYLRKKAIEQAISKEELAWVILNFNQKRGYYQARGEENEEDSNVKEFVVALSVEKVEKGEVDKKNNTRTWYKILLSNGWEYSATFTAEPKWENTEKEFLVTEEYDDDGNIKVVKDKKSDTSGKEKRRISLLPTFDEINLMSKKDQDKIYGKIKARTEATIQNSHTTVGAYIYESLKQNPSQKINGKLVRTIERKFYKEELKQILKKQIELQPNLFTEDLFNDCTRELYRSNEVHQQSLIKRDFVHLFLDDIIYYQRPLRSQKHTVTNCSLEYKGYVLKDGLNQSFVKGPVKVVPKSNPYFQEFRIWQWVRNLNIYERENDNIVTHEFLKDVDQIEALFDFLNNRKEVEQKAVIDFLLKQKLGVNKVPKAEIEKYRWNYVEDKKYPCNETKSLFSSRLARVDGLPDGFLSNDILYKIWHIIYSVTDKVEYEKALATFAKKYKINEISFVQNFRNLPPFRSEYGGYSEKAIKKLLSLMRVGKHWSWDAIDEKTRVRIDKILTGEFDEEITNRVREMAIHLNAKNDFQGLPEWLAKYIVYGRHSEAIDSTRWKSVADIEEYLNQFKQHSLRNPIVEQVVTETLRVIKDIWSVYGKGTDSFFDEIHVELGREMKNTADERKRLTQQVSDNENTNIRIKALLMELMNDATFENVRAHSPMHQEIMRIYEEYALNSDEKYAGKDAIGRDIFVAENTPDDILKISKLAQPSQSELTKYKLWLEQKYRSPYTGQMIPLSKLFTPAYEIEHIIPQSRYFDDSFSNKVICEAAVNKLKDKQLGLEFVKNHHGEIVDTGNGKEQVRIFTEEEYVTFVKEHYSKLRGKKTKLLLDEIPDQMIERQLNDTRYISKFITSVLSNVVRSERNDDGLNSKNIISGNGKITTILKQDWGLNDVWNKIILPRFERMNSLTQTTSFTTKNKEGHTIPTIPFELSKGFQKKRIDHRHHALDALVIACATRDHVNLLNNQSAKSDNLRYDLQNKLRNKDKWIDKNGTERMKFTSFQLPWANFATQVKIELEGIIVSFKQNNRVINKTKFAGLTYKESKEKSNNMNWAIRQPLHEETVSGYVKLPWVKLGKGEVTTATRKSIDKSFDLKKIEKITDTGIKKILSVYLKQEKFKYEEKGEIKYNSELAFSPEGIEDLNNNISKYNNGKSHQPIYKVRVYEKGKGRFVLGEKGNKKTKYVQGAPNLFFAVYIDENGRRSFETIALKDVIEHQKQQVDLNIAKENRTELPIRPTNGKFDFYLSPGDLVYVPTREELDNYAKIDFKNLTNRQKQRLYNVNDFSATCYFYPNSIAKAVAPKEVDLSFDEKKNKITGSYDTKTASLEGMQIKDVCIKLKVDRLGNISKD